MKGTSLTPNMAKVDLKPHPKWGPPTPFNAARAAELRDAARAMTKGVGNRIVAMVDLMSPGEFAYLLAVYRAIPNRAADILAAFKAILQGETER